MIAIKEVEALPDYIKDMHTMQLVGLGEEIRSDGICVRKFEIEDNDRVAYEDLAEAESVCLVYVRKEER